MFKTRYKFNKDVMKIEHNYKNVTVSFWIAIANVNDSRFLHELFKCLLGRGKAYF